MKLYLAIVTDSMSAMGNYEHVLGVFSTPQLAAAELAKESGFHEAIKVGEFSWKNVFDGELTEFYDVVPAVLDEGLHDY